MTTFDEIVSTVAQTLEAHRASVQALEWLLVNRDLNGRVRIIVPEGVRTDAVTLAGVKLMGAAISVALMPHAYAESAAVLFEADKDLASNCATVVALEGFSNVWLVERLATEGDWTKISLEAKGPPRIVFYSIKGGVGRSTALAATAWSLAQAGLRVLVLDLDLESPGLSTALLPSDRQPTYGITDWLVEDLVDNGETVLDSMIATSGLSHDGEIYIVPAHGAEPGEYVSKLGRVWMPKTPAGEGRENWSARLQRLIDALEARIRPDVLLIDSRAGIDEVASSCVTDLGANLVLLFALEGEQSWSGYRILFEHWKRAGVAQAMRERLQVVGALIPELDPIEYQDGLRERAYDLFAETMYDAIPPGEPLGERWHFEETDESSPHAPWAIKWHRSFAGLRSLQGRLAVIDDQEVNSLFGALIQGIGKTLKLEEVGV